MEQAVRVFPLEPEQVLLFWEKFQPHLETALAKGFGEWDMKDVHAWIMNGEWLPLLVHVDGEPTGLVFCEKVNYPKKRRIKPVLLLGERTDEWIVPFVEVLKIVARDLGFDGIEALVRPAVGKMVRELGFKQPHVQVVWDHGWK